MSRCTKLDTEIKYGLSSHKGMLWLTFDWIYIMLGSVRFENITKTFGNTVALDQFNLKLVQGEFVTLLGASGSGKTTALNILAGFSDATSGEVYIDDKPMTGVAPENRNVGMVFQSFALFPHMTVFENVAFPLRMRRTPKREVDSRVMETLHCQEGKDSALG